MVIIALKILLFIFSLVMLAYFAGIETALTSLSTISIAKMKNEKPYFADALNFWETKPNEILATILVWTNLCLVANGVIAASIALDLLKFVHISGSAMYAGASFISILLTLVLGDVAPKI